MSQSIVSQEELDRLDRFDKCMGGVELAFSSRGKANSAYWWNLWEIYRDELYLAAYEDSDLGTAQSQWFGDLKVSPFGCARSEFYLVRKAIKRWQKLGNTDDEVKVLLENWKMATSKDIEKWFGKDGELKPEVVKTLEAGNETPKEALYRISLLSSSEARSEVGRIADEDEIFFLDDLDWTESQRSLYANIRRDTKSGGSLFSIKIQISDITDSRKYGKKNDPDELRVIAKFLASKFGLDVK